MCIANKNGERIVNMQYFSFDLNNSVAAGVRGEGVGPRIANGVDFLISFLPGQPSMSLSRWLRFGDIYFVVRSKFQICAIGRICFRDTPEMRLHAGQAALISFYTSQAYRGQGLYKAIIIEMLRYLKRNGFHTAFIWADKDNTSSIAGIKSCGFEQFTTEGAIDEG